MIKRSIGFKLGDCLKCRTICVECKQIYTDLHVQTVLYIYTDLHVQKVLYLQIYYMCRQFYIYRSTSTYITGSTNFVAAMWLPDIQIYMCKQFKKRQIVTDVAGLIIFKNKKVTFLTFLLFSVIFFLLPFTFFCSRIYYYDFCSLNFVCFLISLFFFYRLVLACSFTHTKNNNIFFWGGGKFYFNLNEMIYYI